MTSRHASIRLLAAVVTVGLTLSMASQGASAAASGPGLPPVPSGPPAPSAPPTPKPVGYVAATSVVDGRSTYTTDYSNPDGSHTAFMSSTAVNYQSASGPWAPVDNSIVADPSLAGGLTNAANSWHVHFGTTQQGIGIDNAGGALAVVPIGGSLAAPSIDSTGHGVVYHNVWPGADLAYRVYGDGIEESVLIKSASAGSTFKFAVDDGSANAVLSQMSTGSAASATGASSLTPGPSGSLVSSQPSASSIQIGQPLVLDHNGNGLGQAKAAQTTANNQLVLSVSASWLSSQPATAYPITLDPTFTTTASTIKGYKSDGATCTTGCYIQFGDPNDTGTTYWRTVAHFPYESLFGDYITSAQVIPTTWDGGTQNGYQAYIYAATAYSYAGAIGNGTALVHAAPMTQSFYSSALTSQFESWVSARTSGGALGFRGTDTANLYTYQEFEMQLQLTYDRPPATPTNVGFKSARPATPGCATGASRPTIDGTMAFTWQAKLTDPDGDQVHAAFQYWDLATPTIVHTTASSTYVTSGNYAWIGMAGSTSTWLDGHNFAYRALAGDGKLNSASWSGTCEFHVYDPPPNVPTTLSFASPAGPCGSAVTSTGQVVLSAYISDPDNAYGKKVWADFRIPTTQSGTQWSTTTQTTGSTSAGIVTATVPINTLATSGSFTWYVKADNGQYQSAEVSCTGTVDNSSPAPPQITAGGDFGRNGSPAGQIGDSDTITMTTPGSSPAKVVYAVTTQPLSGSNPLPAGTCGAPPVNGVYTVCPSQGTGWNQFRYRALVPTFYVTAQAYSAAGTQGTIGSQEFDVNEAPITHEWMTGNLASTDTSVPDAFGGPALALSAAGASIENDSTEYGAAIHLDNSLTGSASTGAGTSTVQIDLTHSFTVAVWVRPYAASSNTVANVALGEDGAVKSGFMLGQFSGYWSFCMPHNQTYSTGPYDGDCAYVAQPTDGSSVNSWTLLVGEWDSAAQQMHLFVNGSESGALSPVSHTSTGAASGAFTVGEAQNVYEYPSWYGDVQDPVSWSGILDADQLTFIAIQGPPGMCC